VALSDVYAALEESLTGQSPNQQIDLFSAAGRPALAKLKPVLEAFGITGSYVLSKAELTMTASAVTLAGGGSFGVPGAATKNVLPVNGKLVFTSPAGVDECELSLAFVEPGWTFSKTFPELPHCQVNVEGSVLFQPSFLADLQLEGPAFSAASAAGGKPSLQLSGGLKPAGALGPYEDQFTTWPLPLDGTVVLPASPAESPQLDLAARSTKTTIELGPVALREVGFRLQSLTGLDPQIDRVEELSVLEAIGTLDIGKTEPVAAHLSTQLLANADLWRFTIAFEPGKVGLAEGLSAITDLFGIPPGDLPLPSGFDSFTGFYLAGVEIGVREPGAEGWGLDHIAVTLGSSKEWVPPIPFVRIREVGTRWLVGWEAGSAKPVYISGCVYGGVRIGEGAPKLPAPPGPAVREPEAEVLPATAAGEAAKAFTIDLTAYIPQFTMLAELRTGDRIPIGVALRHFFGDPGPETPNDMEISEFTFEADPRARTYFGTATITTADDKGWTVPLIGKVELTLSYLTLRILAAQGALSGSVEGQLVLQGGGPPGGEPPTFLLAAEYAGSASADGWVFKGELLPGSFLDLGALVSNLLGVEPPDDLPKVYVEAMSLKFATKSKAYEAAGQVAGRWNTKLFGSDLEFSLVAGAEVARPAGAPSPSGRLHGRFAVNKIAVEAAMDVGVKEPTYLFKVEFGEIWLEAVTGWRGEDKKRHQVLSIRLGGVTLGAILEYLVNLAAPTIGFKLDPPWDVLNRIDLSSFTLTIDSVEGSVELTYAANVDLVGGHIDTVGARYLKRKGAPAVELVLTGNLLGTEYKDENALSWNVISDPPPAVPGQGSKLLEIRYLGIGQRVALKGGPPETVKAAVERLADAMRPPEDPEANPLTQPSGEGMVFAADSEILAALDITVASTVSLAIVFNDPRMYGLALGLDGPRAGALAGLRFEILYTKIADDLGVFRIELRVPDAFRTIQLGAASLTLGIILVEIYTNGNFRVDLGFPHNRDYSRSFTVQVLPFIGRGGIYFGLLDGRTSSRVPQITNGTFAPVIELGVGFAVGVGKEVRLGPLSGGAFVQVEVIFEGAFGTFNPTAADASPATYYWGQGIAAIYGKVYAEVDFVVVKASVTIEAWASASVVFEAYKATHFELDVGVSVRASVKILFVRISFSFTATLKAPFTVGNDQPTPWMLAGGQGTPSQERRRLNALPPLARHPALRAELLRTRHLLDLHRAGAIEALPAPGADLASGEAPFVLDWDPSRKVWPDSPKQAAITMLPAFSRAALPVAWSGSAPPPDPTPGYRVALLLFAQNGVDTPDDELAASGERTAELSAHAAEPGELPADRLIEAFLRWSISAVTGDAGGQGATVDAGQIRTLFDQMQRPETSEEGFAIEKLAEFFATNLHLQISGKPEGEEPVEHGGMAVPVPPFLEWSSPQGGSHDFEKEGKVGKLYEWGAAKYAAQFATVDRSPGPPPSDDDPSKYESYAPYAFRDWCLMLARTATQSARDALEEWKVELTADGSLAAVAGGFPRVTVEYAVRAGDSVDSVAAALGATPAELLSLNPDLDHRLETAAPGSILQLALGVVAESVALDNAAVPLKPEVKLTLGDVEYQVSQGDTLASIAKSFEIADPLDLFAGGELEKDDQLLLAGAELPIDPLQYQPPAGTPTLLAAAVFYVRWQAPQSLPDAGWYAQTVFDLNQHGALAGIDHDQPIPAGTVLQVPKALGDPSPADAIPYTTFPGDTLTRIGGALTLWQNYATGTEPEKAWGEFRDQVSGSGGSVSLPKSSTRVQPGETVAELAARSIFASALAAAVSWIAGQPVLNPLALVKVSGFTAETDGEATLAAIAHRFGLAVEDLAGRIADIPIFTASPKQPLTLTVAHVPAQEIDVLVDYVLTGEAAAKISAMSSRQFLGGLRLPAPKDVGEGHLAAEGPLEALYELTGQQFHGPAPDPGKPDETGLEITVSANQAAGWITLMEATTVAAGETLERLAERVPRLRELNAAVEAGVVPGMIVHADEASSLVFTFTNAQLLSEYPGVEPSQPPKDIGLLPGPVAPTPQPMKLASEAPRTYGLDHHVELQSPVALPIPAGGAPLTGNASLWPFPAALLERARAGGATRYDVVRAQRSPGSEKPHENLTDATFATAISFSVRKLTTAGTYEVLGAEAGDRQLLLDLWLHLDEPDTPAGTRAFIAVDPAPNAGNATGLAVLAADPARTYLLKTNESTETHPSGAAAAANGASSYYAPFSSEELARFLLLLWEGSIPGSGFYLGFATVDGQDLPAGAFDEHGTATLQLLVVAGEQQAPAPEGRPLLPFDTCAIVAPGLQPGTSSLYVEAADESDLVRTAVVPPGVIGFDLTLPRPQVEKGMTPAEEVQPKLRQLFSLSTYEVPKTKGSPFVVPPVGLPAPPQEEDLPPQEDGAPEPLWRRARMERWARCGREVAAAPGTGDYWRYHETLPIARFAPLSLPAVDPLPDPAADPYRGIGSGALQKATIALGFADVLGNATAPPASGGTIEAPVGYTDDLLGVSAWPAVTTAYTLAPAAAGKASLSITIAPQPAATAPAARQNPQTAIDLAAKQAERYATAYYQLPQGLGFQVLTTLAQDANGVPAPQEIDGTPLWRYVTASYLATRAASAVEPVPAQGTLEAVVSGNGLTYADLAEASADLPIEKLLGARSLTVPAYAVWADAATAEDVRAPRPGWPSPATGAAMLEMPENAKVLPLRPGVTLSTPERSVPVPEPATTLAKLAEASQTTPGLLAGDSATVAGVLAEGFVFEMEGLSVTVGGTTPKSATPVLSFEDVHTAFEELGVRASIADIATANGEREGMLVAKATLTSLHYVAQEGDTLASNESGASVADLATANAKTPGLIAAGALAYLGDFTPAPAIAAGETATLRQFAERYACPVELLLAANPDLQLPANSTMTLPGTVAVPGGKPPWVPCSVQANDTLDGIAGRFLSAPGDGSPAVDLATANLHMPGTIAGGGAIAVTVDGSTFSTPTQEGDSFASVLERLQEQHATIELGDVVATIGPSPGYLAAGSVLACPPAQVPGPEPQTTAAAAAAYGLEAAAFAQANAGLTGLIAAGVTLRSPDDKASVTTGENDTFNSILSRFAAAHAQVGIADVVAANPDAKLIRGGGVALLPPVPVVSEVELAAAAPTYAEPVFPLTVSLRIEREPATVDPEFRTEAGDGPVERADSPIAAPVEPHGEHGKAPKPGDFAKELEEAFPTLRLATGKAADTEADLWAVDFGAGGISDVTVAPGVEHGSRKWPRFFALKPLYNELVTRAGVQVKKLEEDGKLAKTGTPTNYQGVDVEVWARRFLADLDRFLAAPYATAVYADAAARASLDEALEAKATLSEAIPQGLAPVLVVQDPKAEEGREEAEGVLGQQLAASLSSAYEVAAVLQYDAEVSSPWTAPGSKLPPARLYGSAEQTLYLGSDESPSADERPYTLAAAGTDLTKPESFVTFLMKVRDPAHQGTVNVDLDYEVPNLAFGIEPVDKAPGYASSDWLAFVPPLAGVDRPAALQTHLGRATVPIALRSYPGLPVLVGQQAEPTHPEPSLAETTLWSYRLTYSHEHAAQDIVAVTAAFNVPSPAFGGDANEGEEDVAVALAKYVAVADGLWALLAGYAEAKKKVDPAARANAAQTFGELAQAVASAWKRRWAPSVQAEVEEPAAQEAGPEPVEFKFEVRLQWQEDGTAAGGMRLQALSLKRLQDEPGPAGKWPRVFCRAADGSDVELTLKEEEEGTATYTAPPEPVISAGSWPIVTLDWEGLDVTAFQNAKASLSVSRNQKLLGDQGPDTTEGFVYQTPTVDAPAPVLPLNLWPQSFEIAGDDVAGALQAAFGHLFGSQEGLPMTISVAYGYGTVPGDEDLLIFLPVTLYPNVELSAQTAGAVAAAVKAWEDGAKPNPDFPYRIWAFSVTLHSQVNPTSLAPLLALERLTYKIPADAAPG